MISIIITALPKEWIRKVDDCMNINQLQYFQVTCKYENISKAAQELHVSQSAISKSLRELEKEFEINLFNRFNNSLYLTPEGKSFLEMVNKILAEVDFFYTSVRDINDKNNIIRVGASPLVGSCLLPPFYQELHDYDSTIMLDYVELKTYDILANIENESLDIGLIASNDINLTRFGYTNLLDVSMVFCTNINNPLSKYKTISFENLKEEPLVLVRPDSIENKLLLERFNEHNIVPNILLYSDQVYTIQHCINHEIASSFLYNIVVPRNNEIKQIPLESPITLNIALVWKKDRYLHNGIKKLIKFSKNFTFCHYHG